jgi:hypothetical protein
VKLLYQASGLSNGEFSIPSWMPDSKKSELFEKQFINLSACHGLQYKAAADTSLRI